MEYIATVEHEHIVKMKVIPNCLGHVNLFVVKMSTVIWRWYAEYPYRTTHRIRNHPKQYIHSASRAEYQSSHWPQSQWNTINNNNNNNKMCANEYLNINTYGTWSIIILNQLFVQRSLFVCFFSFALQQFQITNCKFLICILDAC